jgi:hypothetical protein
MCAELFVNYKVFGRVIIREKKETLFVGTIKKIKWLWLYYNSWNLIIIYQKLTKTSDIFPLPTDLFLVLKWVIALLWLLTEF